MYFIFRRKAYTLIKKWKIKSIGEDVEKLEPSYIAGGNINSAAVMEPNSFGSSKKAKTCYMTR